jgi:hypothetical protein
MSDQERPAKTNKQLVYDVCLAFGHDGFSADDLVLAMMGELSRVSTMNALYRLHEDGYLEWTDGLHTSRRAVPGAGPLKPRKANGRAHHKTISPENWWLPWYQQEWVGAYLDQVPRRQATTTEIVNALGLTPEQVANAMGRLGEWVGRPPHNSSEKWGAFGEPEGYLSAHHYGLGVPPVGERISRHIIETHKDDVALRPPTGVPEAHIGGGGGELPEEFSGVGVGGAGGGGYTPPIIIGPNIPWQASKAVRMQLLDDGSLVPLEDEIADWSGLPPEEEQEEAQEEEPEVPEEEPVQEAEDEEPEEDQEMESWPPLGYCFTVERPGGPVIAVRGEDGVPYNFRMSCEYNALVDACYEKDVLLKKKDALLADLSHELEHALNEKDAQVELVIDQKEIVARMVVERAELIDELRETQHGKLRLEDEVTKLESRAKQVFLLKEQLSDMEDEMAKLKARELLDAEEVRRNLAGYNRIAGEKKAMIEQIAQLTHDRERLAQQQDRTEVKELQAQLAEHKAAISMFAVGLNWMSLLVKK